MRFILLIKKIKFMISVLTKCIAENIKKSIIYTVLSISTCKIKKLCINIRRI